MPGRSRPTLRLRTSRQIAPTGNGVVPCGAIGSEKRRTRCERNGLRPSVAVGSVRECPAGTADRGAGGTGQPWRASERGLPREATRAERLDHMHGAPPSGPVARRPPGTSVTESRAHISSKSARRHVVDPRPAPRMATHDSAQGQPSSATRSMGGERLQCVGRAGRVVAAVEPDPGREDQPVAPDGKGQDAGGQGRGPMSGGRTGTHGCSRVSASMRSARRVAKSRAAVSSRRPIST